MIPQLNRHNTKFRHETPGISASDSCAALVTTSMLLVFCAAMIGGAIGVPGLAITRQSDDLTHAQLPPDAGHGALIGPGLDSPGRSAPPAVVAAAHDTEPHD